MSENGILGVKVFYVITKLEPLKLKTLQIRAIGTN